MWIIQVSITIMRESGIYELRCFTPAHSYALSFIYSVDLEAHIRDLQEVTETTNSSRLEAERKLKLLQDENRELKSKSVNAAESQVQS